MENNFTKIMSVKTDNELIKIVTVDSKKYQKTALEAAKEEIALRQLDISANIAEFKIQTEKENIEREKQDLAQKQKSKEINKNIARTTLRGINFLVDLFVVIVLYLFTIFIIKNTTNIISPREIILINRTTLFCVFIFYFIIAETIFQKTIGKLLTKTKVIDLEGGKPNFLKITTRTFSRLIPLDGISYLYTINGFHDKIAKTVVVTDKYPN